MNVREFASALIASVCLITSCNHHGLNKSIMEEPLTAEEISYISSRNADFTEAYQVISSIRERSSETFKKKYSSITYQNILNFIHDEKDIEFIKKQYRAAEDEYAKHEDWVTAKDKADSIIAHWKEEAAKIRVEDYVEVTFDGRKTQKDYMTGQTYKIPIVKVIPKNGHRIQGVIFYGCYTSPFSQTNDERNSILCLGNRVLSEEISTSISDIEFFKQSPVYEAKMSIVDVYIGKSLFDQHSIFASVYNAAPKIIKERVFMKGSTNLSEDDYTLIIRTLVDNSYMTLKEYQQSVYHNALAKKYPLIWQLLSE